MESESFKIHDLSGVAVCQLPITEFAQTQSVFSPATRPLAAR
jgi:hypothetical protein